MYSIDDPNAVNILYGIGSKMPKSDWYSAWADPSIPDHNLFSARNEKFHSEMRKRVANLYSLSTIKNYEPGVNRCITILIQQLDSFIEYGKIIDLQHWMQCYAFDVIGEITFGRCFGFMESGGQDVGKIMDILEKGVSFSSMIGISKLLAPLWILLYGDPTKGLAQFEKHAEANRQDLEDGRVETFSAKVETLKKKSPSDYEFYHVNTVMFGNIAAGSDTTSISLTSVLYNVIKDRRIWNKLREELESAIELGEASIPVTLEQAQKLPYLQLVIKEALRVHPATGLPLWRETQSPVKIAGQTFPKGTVVGINSWVAHANQSVFGSDAAEFRPERWDSRIQDPAKLKAMEQYFIPFGHGSRTCIGRHISMLEMLKVIPELVRRYDFELVGQDMTTKNHWFVKQKNVNVRILKR